VSTFKNVSFVFLYKDKTSGIYTKGCANIAVEIIPDEKTKKMD